MKSTKIGKEKKSLKNFFRHSFLHASGDQSTPSLLPSPQSSVSQPYAKLKVVKGKLIRAESDREAMGDLDIFVRLQEEQEFVTMLEAMGSFSRIMRQVYKPTADPHHNAATTRATIIDQGIKPENGPAYLARDLMQTLHGSLTDCLTDCGLDHKARLHLPVLQKAEPAVPSLDVDMFLSTCTEPRKWQEAKCLVRRCVLFPQLAMESEPILYIWRYQHYSSWLLPTSHRSTQSMQYNKLIPGPETIIAPSCCRRKIVGPFSSAGEAAKSKGFSKHFTIYSLRQWPLWPDQAERPI